MTSFSMPDWVPILPEGARILIAGASGGIGRAVTQILLRSPDVILGLHSTQQGTFDNLDIKGHKVYPLISMLDNETHCSNLVEMYCNYAGGIDGLVVLSGGIERSCHWKNLTEDEWLMDLNLNLNVPFFLARRALFQMTSSNSGSIILMGTESSLHGGSPTSFPYAVAKKGIECLVQGLAREGAGHGITVNGVRPGFIASGFHERWQGKNAEALAERAEMLPLKRAGRPEEVAALIAYLLSGWARFITGQMLPITGGDWL